MTPLRIPPKTCLRRQIPQTLNAKIGGSAPILSADSCYLHPRTPEGRLKALTESCKPADYAIFVEFGCFNTPKLTKQNKLAGRQFGDIQIRGSALICYR